MDDSIGETVKTAVGGEISDKAIKGILSFIIGAKNANAALGVLGPVAMISDVCSILEMKSWAMYYRSLCYSDDDTFLIYRVKSFLSTVGDIGITLPGDVRLSLIDTPQIIVLPTEVKNTDWQISAGRIYGGVLYRDGQDWKEDNVAKVSFYNPKLGTSRVEVDKTGRYSFIANACGPDKSYEVGALGRYDDWNNLPVAQTNVSVQTGNGYEVLFYLDDLGCTSKYHTYITNDDPILSPHHMAVACMIPPGANQNQPCKTLNSSSLGCMDMTLSDGKIACSGDTTTNPGSTLIYDTATGETRKGPGDNFGVHCNSPILKGGKLVCYTGTIVNIYDLSNDTLIYSIPNSYNPVDGTRYFQDLSIWGNSLVFRGSKNLNGDDDLYLTTLGETAIQDLGKIGHQPYIFNGRIAYTALSDPTNIEGSGEIRVYDSASSSNYLVGNKNGQEPRIDGNNIVYSYLEDDLSKEALQYSLQVVDISNLSQPKINVIAQGTIGMSYLNSYGYTDAYSIVRNYGVSGDYIAYLDPSTASAVQLYNISNGVTTTIYNGRVNGSGHVLGTTNSNYPSVQISGRDIIISPHESSWLICKF